MTAIEILERRMRLPRAETCDVRVRAGSRIAMDDGAVLLADRYVAQAARLGRSRRCWCAHATRRQVSA